MIKMVVKFVLVVMVFAQILAPIAEAAQGRAVYYNPPYTSNIQLYISLFYILQTYH